jgi:HAMP domain-containing protein
VLNLSAPKISTGDVNDRRIIFDGLINILKNEKNTVTNLKSENTFSSAGNEYNLPYISEEDGNTSNLGFWLDIELPEKIVPTLFAYNTSCVSSDDLAEKHKTPKNFVFLGKQKEDNSNTFTLLRIEHEYTITNTDFESLNYFTLKNTNKTYDKFRFGIMSTNFPNDNTILPVSIGGLKVFGKNGYFGNMKSFIQKPDLIKDKVLFNNVQSVGINNFNPISTVSINPDISTDTSIQSILNLNFDNVESQFITTTQNNPKYAFNVIRKAETTSGAIGVRASHKLGAFNFSHNSSPLNTRYDIELSHERIDSVAHYHGQDRLPTLSLLSDGRIGVGMTPDPTTAEDSNLHGISINKNINIYPNPVDYSKNIQIVAPDALTTSYKIELPSSYSPNQNIPGQVLKILSADEDGIKTEWDVAKVDTTLANLPNITIGNSDYPERKVSHSHALDSNIYIFQADKIVVGSRGDNFIIDDEIKTDSNIESNSLMIEGNTFCIGSIFATVDITTDSDISYKADFSNISYPLDKISNLTGYTFTRNDTDLTDRRFTGLIAQDVQKVIPEAILEKPDGKLRVMYGNLSGLFVEAFKEMRTEINQLKNEIATLKQSIQ